MCKELGPHLTCGELERRCGLVVVCNSEAMAVKLVCFKVAGNSGETHKQKPKIKILFFFNGFRHLRA